MDEPNWRRDNVEQMAKIEAGVMAQAQRRGVDPLVVALERIHELSGHLVFLKMGNQSLLVAQALIDRAIFMTKECIMTEIQ